jgi:hypothetical protein
MGANEAARIPVLKAYAIISAEAPEKVVEVFLRCEDAERFLQECLRDVPAWADVFRVEEIEFGERHLSAN